MISDVDFVGKLIVFQGHKDDLIESCHQVRQRLMGSTSEHGQCVVLIVGHCYTAHRSKITDIDLCVVGDQELDVLQAIRPPLGVVISASVPPATVTTLLPG
jgi:hypothetical protein